MDNNKSKSAAPREQLNIQMVWLDSNIDASIFLRASVVKTFAWSSLVPWNKTQFEQWAKNWPKVKGIFTEISLICEALKQAV